MHLEQLAWAAGFIGMETPDNEMRAQYQRFALECDQIAIKAKSEDQRKVLQQMAETWRRLAEEGKAIEDEGKPD
jgi:hypothetical protein